MTDAGFDRRLRGWLEERDPGPVPSSLRADVARVPVETPIPIAGRVWQAIVGAGGSAGRAGSAMRLAVVLVLLGLLLALVASFYVTTGRPIPPSAWGDYVVGQPAPDREFGSVAGSLAVGDPTIGVDDLQGFVVVLYFPGQATAERTSADAGTLATAADHTPRGTAFVVVASPSSPISTETLEQLHGAGMLTAKPPADWAPPPSDAEPALVITDRAGVVKYVFAGELPNADQLVGDLDRASLP